jgi:hypothetical protein
MAASAINPHERFAVPDDVRGRSSEPRGRMRGWSPTS